MDKSELIVPSESSHWTLRLVDAKKPYPKHILANVTYKIVRFFYPPFALEAVDVTHVVSNPEVNAVNVGLFLFFFFLVALAGWRYFQKPLVTLQKTAVRKPTGPLVEKQASPKNDSEKKKNTTNALVEPKWLSESKDSFFDASLGKEDREIDDARCRTKKDRDGNNQNDLVKQIDRAVWERTLTKKRKNP